MSLQQMARYGTPQQKTPSNATQLTPTLDAEGYQSNSELLDTFFQPDKMTRYEEFCTWWSDTPLQELLEELKKSGRSAPKNRKPIGIYDIPVH